MLLVVIDTYEHAFYIDYRKAGYIEMLMAHIDCRLPPHAFHWSERLFAGRA